MADASGASPVLMMTRSTQSGNYTMTGAFQAIYSDSSTQPYIFYGGWFDLTNMADGDVITVRVRKTIASGGAWIVASQISYVNAQPIGSKVKPIGPIADVYGIEVSMYQPLVAANFIVIGTEWFPAKRLGV